MCIRDRAIHYITKEYMNDISVADIADRIGITRSYLAKCFNYTLDMSPKQFIIKYRMDKACELLKASNYNITEISEATGYSNSVSYTHLDVYKRQIKRRYAHCKLVLFCLWILGISCLDIIRSCLNLIICKEVWTNSSM